MQRCLDMYHHILPAQLYRLFPDYDDAFVKNVITRLNYKRLLRFDQAKGYLVRASCVQPADKWLLKAIWVMLDHLDEPSSHTLGEYPVKLSFVSGGKLYDVVAAPPGDELLVSLALAKRKGEQTPCYVVLEYPEQILQMECPEDTVYCLVSMEGEIKYYKKMEGAFEEL